MQTTFPPFATGVSSGVKAVIAKDGAGAYVFLHVLDVVLALIANTDIAFYPIVSSPPSPRSGVVKFPVSEETPF